MSSPSIDLPSIQTNFAPYLSSTSSSSKSNSNRSSPPHHPHHPHHPQRMPSTPTLASPALSFQSRSFSLTSRFSSSSLHSQYSACSTSGRSPSASPGPATPCDVLSRSPSFSQDRPISLPHPHHHQQHHAGAAGPHKGSMHGTHGGHHDQAQDKHASLILSPFSPLPQERERYSHQLPPFHGLPSRQHHHPNHYQPYQSTQHQHHQQAQQQQQHQQQQQQHNIHQHHHNQPHHSQQQYQQPAHHNPHHHIRESIPHPATASAPTTAPTRFRQYSGQQTAASSPYPPQSPLLGRDHVDYSPASSQREFHARMASAPATAPWTGPSASSASTTPSGMMMNHGPGGDYFSRPSTPPSSFSSYSHHLPTPSTPITPAIVKEENQCSSRLVYSPVSSLSISAPPPPHHAPAPASVVTAPPPPPTSMIPSSLSSILSTPLTPTLPHLQVSTRNIATVGQGHASPFVKNEEYSPAMYPKNHPYAHHLQHHRRRSSTGSSEEGREYSRESSPYTPSEQRHYMQQGGPLHPYGSSPSHHSFIKNERMDSPPSPSSPSSSSMGNSNSNNNNSSQLLLCPVCSRAFKPSKNQNCNLRRHLKNVHNMSPTMHPRKCKWDSLPDGRVKDDKDRKERTRKSKRLWARKFRQRRKVEEAAVVLSMLSQAL